MITYSARQKGIRRKQFPPSPSLVSHAQCGAYNDEMATQIGNVASVGVRELHNRTSELIRQVAESELDLTVTVHGMRVARIVPIDENDPVEELRRQGLIREGRRSGRPLAPAIKLKDGATVSDLVKEQRR